MNCQIGGRTVLQEPAMLDTTVFPIMTKWPPWFSNSKISSSYHTGLMALFRTRLRGARFCLI